VTADEPVGWNPTKKVLARANKKKVDPNSALAKHKKFLRNLMD
jgi:hypothetical protein